jgi:hypothetical protein
MVTNGLAVRVLPVVEDVFDQSLADDDLSQADDDLSQADDNLGPADDDLGPADDVKFTC